MLFKAVFYRKSFSSRTLADINAFNSLTFYASPTLLSHRFPSRIDYCARVLYREF